MGLKDWEVVELSIVAHDQVEYQVWWLEHRSCPICFRAEKHNDYCVPGAAVDLLHNGPNHRTDFTVVSGKG